MKKQLKNKTRNLKPLLVANVVVDFVTALFACVFWILRMLKQSKIIHISNSDIHMLEFINAPLGLITFVIGVVLMVLLKNSNVGEGKFNKKAILISNAVIQSVVFLLQLLIALQFLGVDVLPLLEREVEQYMIPCVALVTLLIAIINTIALAQMKNNKNKKR